MMKKSLFAFITLGFLLSCAPKENTAIANNASVENTNSNNHIQNNDLPVKSTIRKGSFYSVQEIDLAKVLDRNKVAYTNVKGIYERLVIEIPNQPELSKKMTFAIDKALIESSGCETCKDYESFLLYVSNQLLEFSQGEVFFILQYESISEDLYPNVVAVNGYWGSVALHGNSYTPEFEIKLNGKTGEPLTTLFNVSDEVIKAEIKKLYHAGQAYAYSFEKGIDKNIVLKKEWNNYKTLDCRFEGAQLSNYPDIFTILNITPEYVIFDYNFCDYPKYKNIGAVPRASFEKYIEK